MSLYRSHDSIQGRVTALLRLLGDGPVAVAASLAKQGCYGEQHSCDACPIAVYLLKSDLNPIAVSVTEECIKLTFADGAVEYVEDISRAVTDFIVQYDEGAFAELRGRPTKAVKQ